MIAGYARRPLWQVQCCAGLEPLPRSCSIPTSRLSSSLASMALPARAAKGLKAGALGSSDSSFAVPASVGLGRSSANFSRRLWSPPARGSAAPEAEASAGGLLSPLSVPSSSSCPSSSTVARLLGSRRPILIMRLPNLHVRMCLRQDAFVIGRQHGLDDALSKTMP